MNEVASYAGTAYRRGGVPKVLWPIATQARQSIDNATSVGWIGSLLLGVGPTILGATFSFLVVGVWWVTPAIMVALAATYLWAGFSHRYQAVQTQLPTHHNDIYGLLSTRALDGLEKMYQTGHGVSWSPLSALVTDKDYRELADEALSIVAITDNPDTPRVVNDALVSLHFKMCSKRRELEMSSPSFAEDISHIVERG